MSPTIFRLCLIGCLHVVLAVLLYYLRINRAEGTLPLLSVDFIVFILPSLLAFVLYLLTGITGSLFRGNDPVLRWLCCTAIALLGTIVSTAASMFILLNLFGSHSSGV